MTFMPHAIDDLFLSLPEDEKAAIIGYSVAFRLPHLRKRLFLAQEKVKGFQEKYQSVNIAYEYVMDSTELWDVSAVTMSQLRPAEGAL